MKKREKEMKKQQKIEMKEAKKNHKLVKSQSIARVQVTNQGLNRQETQRAETARNHLGLLKN